MERTFELPFGTMTAPELAGATLLETVVHGGDSSPATGEALTSPRHWHPTVQHAGAIHVYGADLFAQDRSEWDPDTHERRRDEPEFAFRYFEEQNARFGPSES